MNQINKNIFIDIPSSPCSEDEKNYNPLENNNNEISGNQEKNNEDQTNNNENYNPLEHPTSIVKFYTHNKEKRINEFVCKLKIQNPPFEISSLWNVYNYDKKITKITKI
jgi:hypothetical protein